MKRKRSSAKRVWLLVVIVLALGAGWWCWVQTQSKQSTVLYHPRPIRTPLPVPQRTQTPAATNPPTRFSEPTRNSPKEPASQHVAESSRVTPRSVLETNAISTNAPVSFPRTMQSVFEMQVALARLGISCGSIDGKIGPQTRAAVRAFQRMMHVEVTGEFDAACRERLLLNEPPTSVYVVSSNDLARLQPLSGTWLGKSQQSALEYETLLELVSESSQASPSLIRRLNPRQDWTAVADCTRLELPDPTYVGNGRQVAFLTIQLSDKVLEGWDDQTNLVIHFPCSIARKVEKRPIGLLHVSVIVQHPNYTFDPENFPESAEAQELRTKLILPPGPNNPVGTAWIGLDKPGYGIHGTPNPEQVGRTESHGCFRLANWNAECLTRLVTVGTPVYVDP